MSDLCRGVGLRGVGSRPAEAPGARLLPPFGGGIGGSARGGAACVEPSCVPASAGTRSLVIVTSSHHTPVCNCRRQWRGRVWRYKVVTPQRRERGDQNNIYMWAYSPVEDTGIGAKEHTALYRQLLLPLRRQQCQLLLNTRWCLQAYHSHATFAGPTTLPNSKASVTSSMSPRSRPLFLLRVIHF